MTRSLSAGFEFWRDLFTFSGAAGRLVFWRVLIFGAFATAVWQIEIATETSIAVDLTPYEVVGAALSLLLVLRTNAGYDRWWEARKLWGGIVNQSRDLAVAALAYGPADRAWREQVVRWTIAFAHATRRSLRDERVAPELVSLLGPAQAGRVLAADHMPTYASTRIAELLGTAVGGEQLSQFAFLQLDRNRGLLLDHVGGCERIRNTPLPKAYAVKIRQFLVLFLLALPFAFVIRVGWLTPWVTILVAYPILALDEIGAELQQPFSTTSLNHLPLDDICATIERNLLSLFDGASS